MSIFKPINSAESNLFTIRLSLGVDSILGKFNNLNSDCNIVSNNSLISVTQDYLSSPTNNNLPLKFVLTYELSSKTFKVTYGKQFVEQPNINITPHLSIGSFAISTIQKNSIYDTSNNLEINFLDSSGTAIAPSTEGMVGLLGFDLEIIGPVKIGTTIGNSNKGWAVNDNGDIYSLMDLNLGSTNISKDSVIISKNLKFLGSNGITKVFTTNDILEGDYINTVWELNNVNLINLTPQLGMFLIVYRNGLNNSSIKLNSNCFLNNTTNNTISFETDSSCVMLYASSTSKFIILSSTGTISLLST